MRFDSSVALTPSLVPSRSALISSCCNASSTTAKSASCWGSICSKSAGGVRNDNGSRVIEVQCSATDSGEHIKRLTIRSVPRSPPAIAPIAQMTNRSGTLSLPPSQALAFLLSLTLADDIASTRSLSGERLEDLAQEACEYCSNIKCALLPPKPKLLMAARLIFFEDQGSHLVCGYKLESLKLEFSAPSIRVGGKVSCSSANVSLSKLANPATVIVWPVLDFTEPTGSCSHCA